MDYFYQRRGISLPVERVFNPNMDEALENADVCSLIGNDWTMNTYPQKFHDKIHLVGVTGSFLSKIKNIPYSTAMITVFSGIFSII